VRGAAAADQDTWAPGDPVAHALPAEIRAKGWRAFRAAGGPVDKGQAASAWIGSTQMDLVVKVNGRVAEAAGVAETPRPGPATPV